MLIIQARLPDTLRVKKLEIFDLPPERKSPAPGILTKDIGTDWANSMETVVLSVPSAVVDRELNYLLNPGHPDFSLINFDPPEPFEFDPRLK